MKLSSAQARHIAAQLRVDVVSEKSEALPKLRAMMGDHSFFVDDTGISIVEPTHVDGSTEGKVIRLARWTEDRSALEVHDPDVQLETVDLNSPDGDDPA